MYVHIHSPAANKMMGYLRENGLSTYCAHNAFPQGHLLMTNPPLVINEKQLDEAFQIIDKALTIVDDAIKSGTA
jgi:hypothetical protein